MYFHALRAEKGIIANLLIFHHAKPVHSDNLGTNNMSVAKP